MQNVLTRHQMLRIATVAHTDPRTVESYLSGRAQPPTAQRIESALEELGLAHLSVVVVPRNVLIEHGLITADRMAST